MADALIDNPILNAPFVEPTRYFKFSDEGDHQRHCRRPTLEFLLHPHRTPKKKGKQLAFDTEWTQDRIETNDKVNSIRERVKHWREGEYQGVTQF
jgi:type III restriction enzyme